MARARLLMLVLTLAACRSSSKPAAPPTPSPTSAAMEAMLRGHGVPTPPVAAAPAASSAPTALNLADTLVADGRFNTVVALARAAGLLDTVARMGPFTLIAPTDVAFKKLPRGTVEGLLSNPKRLDALLRGIAIPGRRISAKDFSPSLKVKTSQEKLLVVSEKQGALLVAGAHIVIPDLKASNGVIHGIDKVPGL